MKTFSKSVLAVLLCMAMLFSVASVSEPAETAKARTIEDVEAEIAQYNSLLAELRSEMATISENISSLKGQEGENLALIAQLQAELDALDAQIIINKSIMESYDLQIALVIQDRAVVQENYDYRLSMYEKLMQFMYENDNTSDFELLFSSENISEYLTRRDNFTDVMNVANSLLKELEQDIESLKQLNIELDAVRANYDEYQIQLNTAKADRTAKLTEFNTIIGSLQYNQGELTTEYANKNVKINEILKKLKELEQEKEDLINSMANFIWPVEGYGRISSGYGWRSDPFTGASSFHNGVDIAAPRGREIYAVRDGIVTRASWVSGYGNCVIIYHGNGISTLYGHCDNGNSSRPTFPFSVGDYVKQGDVIAYVGTTGRSTGYHLHFSVMQNATLEDSFTKNYIDPFDDELNLLPKVK